MGGFLQAAVKLGPGQSLLGIPVNTPTPDEGALDPSKSVPPVLTLHTSPSSFAGTALLARGVKLAARMDAPSSCTLQGELT